MPIQFRCYSCNKLLSIARRKIGTQVTCPRCSVELTIPGTDQVQPVAVEAEESLEAVASRSGQRATSSQPSPITSDAMDSGPLFEREDFERLLEPAVKKAAAVVAAPPTPPGVALPFQEDGVTISRGAAVSLTVLMVVLLAMAFGTGYLVGIQ